MNRFNDAFNKAGEFFKEKWGQAEKKVNEWSEKSGIERVAKKTWERVDRYQSDIEESRALVKLDRLSAKVSTAFDHAKTEFSNASAKTSEKMSELQGRVFDFQLHVQQNEAIKSINKKIETFSKKIISYFPKKIQEKIADASLKADLNKIIGFTKDLYNKGTINRREYNQILLGIKKYTSQKNEISQEAKKEWTDYLQFEVENKNLEKKESPEFLSQGDVQKAKKFIEFLSDISQKDPNFGTSFIIEVTHKLKDLIEKKTISSFRDNATLEQKMLLLNMLIPKSQPSLSYIQTEKKVKLLTLPATTQTVPVVKKSAKKTAGVFENSGALKKHIEELGKKPLKLTPIPKVIVKHNLEELKKLAVLKEYKSKNKLEAMKTNTSFQEYIEELEKNPIDLSKLTSPATISKTKALDTIVKTNQIILERPVPSVVIPEKKAAPSVQNVPLAERNPVVVMAKKIEEKPASTAPLMEKVDLKETAKFISLFMKGEANAAEKLMDHLKVLRTSWSNAEDSDREELYRLVKSGPFIQLQNKVMPSLREKNSSDMEKTLAKTLLQLQATALGSRVKEIKHLAAEVEKENTPESIEKLNQAIAFLEGFNTKDFRLANKAEILSLLKENQNSLFGNMKETRDSLKKVKTESIHPKNVEKLQNAIAELDKVIVPVEIQYILNEINDSGFSFVQGMENEIKFYQHFIQDERLNKTVRLSKTEKEDLKKFFVSYEIFSKNSRELQNILAENYRMYDELGFEEGIWNSFESTMEWMRSPNFREVYGDKLIELSVIRKLNDELVKKFSPLSKGKYGSLENFTPVSDFIPGFRQIQRFLKFPLFAESLIKTASNQHKESVKTVQNLLKETSSQMNELQRRVEVQKSINDYFLFPGKKDVSGFINQLNNEKKFNLLTVKPTKFDPPELKESVQKLYDQLGLAKLQEFKSLNTNEEKVKWKNEVKSFLPTAIAWGGNIKGLNMLLGEVATIEKTIENARSQIPIAEFIERIANNDELLLEDFSSTLAQIGPKNITPILMETCKKIAENPEDSKAIKLKNLLDRFFENKTYAMKPDVLKDLLVQLKTSYPNVITKGIEEKYKATIEQESEKKLIEFESPALKEGISTFSDSLHGVLDRKLKNFLGEHSEEYEQMVNRIVEDLKILGAVKFIEIEDRDMTDKLGASFDRCSDLFNQVSNFCINTILDEWEKGNVDGGLKEGKHRGVRAIKFFCDILERSLDTKAKSIPNYFLGNAILLALESPILTRLDIEHETEDRSLANISGDKRKQIMDKARELFSIEKNSKNLRAEMNTYFTNIPDTSLLAKDQIMTGTIPLVSEGNINIEQMRTIASYNMERKGRQDLLKEKFLLESPVKLNTQILTEFERIRTKTEKEKTESEKIQYSRSSKLRDSLKRSSNI